MKLSSDWKKINDEKQNNVVISSFILLKKQQIGDW